jgi:hypothetical protein
MPIATIIATTKIIKIITGKPPWCSSCSLGIAVGVGAATGLSAGTCHGRGALARDGSGGLAGVGALGADSSGLNQLGPTSPGGVGFSLGILGGAGGSKPAVGDPPT